jgi:MFS family permease
MNDTTPRHDSHAPPGARLAVPLLALCQALAMTGMTITVTVTVLNGEQLALDKAWSTVPIGVQAVATMATTIPGSALMRRFGRRPGFALGSLLGALGGGLGALSVGIGSFWILCLANLVIGAAMGFNTFFRFAAAEAASEATRARAISLVVAGGVVAAVAGPTLSGVSVDWFQPYRFVGCYLVLSVAFLLILPVLALLRLPRAGPADRSRGGRPLLVIVRQPVVAVAMLSAMIGYGVMVFLMTATPLAMTHHNHSMHAWTWVIETHVLAMFAPSFVTGSLIRRAGVLRILLIGAILLFVAVAVDLAGLAFANFLIGLGLVGLAWNFLFIGGTTLLTEGYRPEERAKVQGLNDFLMYGTVAASSFAAGALHNAFGWTVVNYGVLPMITLVLAAILGLMVARTRGKEPSLLG